MLRTSNIGHRASNLQLPTSGPPTSHFPPPILSLTSEISPSASFSRNDLVPVFGRIQLSHFIFHTFYPRSNTNYPTSAIKHLTSNLRLPTSHLQLPYFLSSIQNYPTSIQGFSPNLDSSVFAEHFLIIQVVGKNPFKTHFSIELLRLKLCIHHFQPHVLESSFPCHSFHPSH